AVLCAPALSRALSAAVLGASAADGGTTVGAAAPAGAGRPPLAPSLVLLTLPVLCLLVITAPGGALLSFAPQLSPSALATSVGLFALTASATLSRWLLGHVADRWGAPRAIPPLLLVGAAGLALCA